MMIIVIRWEVEAWHAIIHAEILRNSLWFQKVSLKRDLVLIHPLLDHVSRITWGWTEARIELISAWAGSGYFPSEQGQAYSGDGISQRGKLPFGPTSWEMGQGSQLGEKRATLASELPTNQSTDSITLWLSVPRRSWIATELCRSCWANNLFWVAA